MLLEFSVKNFLSIKDKIIFSLYASNEIKGHEEYNLIPLGGRDILKTAVIYGANASGKSNLIKAMGFMRKVIINSLKLNPGEPIVSGQDYPSFQLHTETADAPIEMEISFLSEDLYYRYGFVLDANRIYHEWLYYAPEEDEILLYDRSFHEKQYRTETPDIFASLPDLFKDNSLPDNTLLLATLAKFTDSPARKVMKWLGDMFHVITNPDEDWIKLFTYNRLDKQEYREDILQFLQVADTGLENVFSIPYLREDVLKIIPEEELNEWKNIVPLRTKKIFFQHSIFNPEGKVIDLKNWRKEHESAGTQKLFALSGPLLETLHQGQILVIDELDASLHPMIMRFLLGLFHSEEHNPHGAQLVLATHDTQLLSPRFFRRDQIWFTEKDDHGITDLYSLADFDLDDRSDFSRDYFQGRYGAVPFIGDLRQFFEGVEHGDPGE